MSKFLLAVFAIAVTAVPVLAQETNDVQRIAAAKAAVVKIGTGTKARVEVARANKPKVKGFISEIREDDFEVISTDDGSIGIKFNIRYDEVIRIRGKGVDWRNGAINASVFGLKALKVLGDVLRGTCLGPISRCSP